MLFIVNSFIYLISFRSFKNISLQFSFDLCLPGLILLSILGMAFCSLFFLYIIIWNLEFNCDSFLLFTVSFPIFSVGPIQLFQLHSSREPTCFHEVVKIIDSTFLHPKTSFFVFNPPPYPSDLLFPLPLFCSSYIHPQHFLFSMGLCQFLRDYVGCTNKLAELAK